MKKKTNSGKKEKERKSDELKKEEGKEIERNIW